MRLDFGPDARSGTINVDNDDNEKISFQVTLAEWRQTPDGKDEYTESRDLIFFPQMFTVNAHDKRLIRIGFKGPPPASEKAYRLYIAEIQPPPRPQGGGAAQVRVAVRFGVPVFVAPAVPKRAFVMDDPHVVKGKVQVTIHNVGNQSAKFETLDVMHGKDVVAEAIGWHVLPGAARAFEIPIDPAKCVSSGSLDLVANAEGMKLTRSFVASPLLCEHS